MRYRLQRHDGTDCSATMVPITVLRMVPIQRYRHLYRIINLSNITLSIICYAITLSFPTKVVKSHDYPLNADSMQVDYYDCHIELQFIPLLSFLIFYPNSAINSLSSFEPTDM